MDLISLLVTVLIVGLIVWLVVWIMNLLPIAQPFKNIALAIVGVIILIYLVSLLTGGGLPNIHVGR